MIYGRNPSNDDAIVVIIHAMGGHELELIEVSAWL
jgi:hypothetical protein